MKGSLIGGKYRLTRQLGEGAMGVVWEAVNQRTSGKFALKLLRSPNPDLRLRLLREARACGSLKHRNIVEIYDVGETDQGEPFLVMQLLSGETLADLIARLRRLDAPLAARIGRDIAGALVAAHDAGIIHRDLKPANVFLHQEQGAEGFTVKVVDFGVSKIVSAADGAVTVTGGVIGSPVYMSPEQAKALKELDHRTDIWSLGVVLHEMLTGARPFQGSGQELFQKILEGDIPLVSQRVRRIDPGLDDIVARCLERDRNKRIRSASELAAKLDRYAAVTPALPAPAPIAGASSTTTSPLVNLAEPEEQSPLLPPATAPVPVAGAIPVEPQSSRRLLLAIPLVVALLALGGVLLVLRLQGSASAVEPALSATEPASSGVEPARSAAEPTPAAAVEPAPVRPASSVVDAVHPPATAATSAPPAHARMETSAAPSSTSTSATAAGVSAPAVPPGTTAPRAAPPVTATPRATPEKKSIFLHKKPSLLEVP